MAGHIASNRYDDPSLWFKIIDIAVKINRVEPCRWIRGSILDRWTSTTKGDNRGSRIVHFFFFLFFLYSVKRDVEEVSFPKVITRRIVLIILY